MITGRWVTSLWPSAELCVEGVAAKRPFSVWKSGEEMVSGWLVTKLCHLHSDRKGHTAVRNAHGNLQWKGCRWLCSSAICHYDEHLSINCKGRKTCSGSVFEPPWSRVTRLPLQACGTEHYSGNGSQGKPERAVGEEWVCPSRTVPQRPFFLPLAFTSSRFCHLPTAWQAGTKHPTPRLWGSVNIQILTLMLEIKHPHQS